MQLRPHQEHDIGLLRKDMAQHQRVLYQLPTGGGKTVVGSFILNGVYQRQRRALFVVHRQELLLQTSRKLDECEVSHGLIAPNMTMTRDYIQVGMIQTLVKRLERLEEPDIIIIDEAHHACSASYAKLLACFPAARVLGLTATPCRLDGKGLRSHFDHLRSGPPVKWLIEAGYLAPYRLYAPSVMDLSGVGSQGGDFKRGDLEKAADKAKITGDAVSHYMKLTPGQRAIAFCVSIAHSQHVAAQFNSMGIRAQHIDGTEEPCRRTALMEAFARGEIKLLTNCDLVSEGFDVPAIETVILLRPTQSLSLYLQQVGRGLRIFPGKTHATILDHAGNVHRHGLPDQEREWSLEGMRKSSGKGGAHAAAINVATCEKCYAAFERKLRACPSCGHSAAPRARDVKHEAGELVEVDKSLVAFEKKKERSLCRTREDLEAYAKRWGYKPGWVDIQMQFREQRRAQYQQQSGGTGETILWDAG